MLLAKIYFSIILTKTTRLRESTLESIYVIPQSHEQSTWLPAGALRPRPLHALRPRPLHALRPRPLHAPHISPSHTQRILESCTIPTIPAHFWAQNYWLDYWSHTCEPVESLKWSTFWWYYWVNIFDGRCWWGPGRCHWSKGLAKTQKLGLRSLSEDAFLCTC